MIHLFHFCRVEIHLSLLSSFNSITIRRVCLARCLNSDATRMGTLISRQCPAFCTTWRVSELLQNVLRDFHVPWYRTFLPRVHLMDRHHSMLDVEHQARHLSTRGGTRGGFYRVQIIHRRRFRHHLHSLYLITRPSPFRATMCSSVWKRFPSLVPKCHLSVMRPPGTFPATLNITEAPNGSSSPRCGRFFNLSYAEYFHRSPHDMCSGCPSHLQQSTETPKSEQRWDSQHGLKDQ